MIRNAKATQLAVERLFESGGEFTAYEVQAAIKHACERYVRTALTRLQDRGRLEYVTDDATGLRRYRKAAARKPFLLQELMRVRFERAELAA